MFMDKIQCIKQPNGLVVINMDTLLYKVVPYSEITKMADAGYLNNLLSDLDGKPYQSALIPVKYPFSRAIKHTVCYSFL